MRVELTNQTSESSASEKYAKKENKSNGNNLTHETNPWMLDGKTEMKEKNIYKILCKNMTFLLIQSPNE